MTGGSGLFDLKSGSPCGIITLYEVILYEKNHGLISNSNMPLFVSDFYFM